MPPRIDITGQRFGRFTAIEQAGRKVSSSGKSTMILWRCRCVCGNERIVAAGALRYGTHVGCGCGHAGALRTHGENASNSAEYRSWHAMKTRCYYPKHKNYDSYGGRGISVCDEWRTSYEAFLRDMGRRPTPRHSIDRIDVNGNYEPTNCRWATPEEQRANKRSRRNQL